jgi:signal transduction histidine kinase
VPRRWRLRNKLLLGLGLVLGSVGLLLAGTVQGLTSYLGTMKTVDSKLLELQDLDLLKSRINALISQKDQRAEKSVVGKFPPQDDQKKLQERIADARAAFQGYKDRFQDTIKRKRDPDPYQESKLIEDMEKTFKKFEAATNAFYGDGAKIIQDTGWVGADRDVANLHADLMRLCDELHTEIASDVNRKIGWAKKNFQQSITIVISSSILALLLLLTLVYLFSGWMFQPIKKLQAGVQRVAAGDFEQPIDLRSGDELEELATAFNDMTRRLHEIYKDLEQQVNDRSRQLVRSERMVSVGFLAAGVAHEINNPLASIAFCSEALQSRLSEYIKRNPHETEVVAKYLGMIQQEAFRCKTITSKLLEFSRVGERRREPTDLAELIQSVLEMAQYLQSCRGKRIVFQPYARVIAGVNSQDVKSVVLNLVVNALESMDEGGILTITLQARGDSAEMVFSDTGCGMQPETLQNIFEPFFTRNRTGKGTGLGLFISHQIIDQHGGEINAVSAGPGQGSTFTVRVPLQPVHNASEPKEPDVLPFGSGMIKLGTGLTEDGRGHAAA